MPNVLDTVLQQTAIAAERDFCQAVMQCMKEERVSHERAIEKVRAFWNQQMRSMDDALRAQFTSVGMPAETIDALLGQADGDSSALVARAIDRSRAHMQQMRDLVEIDDAARN
jgi:hypothetical protein